MSGNPPWGGVRMLVVVVAVGLLVGAVALVAFGVAAPGHTTPARAGSAAGRAPDAGATSPAVPSLPPNEVYGVEATVPVGATPVGLTFDPANGDVYVTNAQGSSVSVINGATEKVVATIGVGASPAGLAYDSSSHVVYVVNSLQDTVSEIGSANTVTGNFSVPYEPAGIVYASSDGDLYITQEGSNATSVYSPSAPGTPVAVIPVGHQPLGIAYDPDNTEVYVANSNSSNISVINTTDNAVVATIPVGNAPLGLAYDSGQQELFVANVDSNNTTVISTVSNLVVASINAGQYPVGAAYNPDLGVVLVTDEKSAQVRVILDSNNSVVATVPVGSDPVGVAWDSANGYEYVANGNSSNVSVIGTPSVPPYAVDFAETGLPAGTSWTVTLNSAPESGTQSTIAYSEPNGSYSFTVTPIAGYLGSPLSGSFSVNGFPVTETIAFTQVTYVITFTEKGLGSSLNWSVTINGATYQTYTDSVIVELPNGSYAFTVPSVSGYSVAPAASWANVTGSSVAVNVTFTQNSGTTPTLSTPVGGIPLWEIVLIAIVVVVAAAIAVMALRRARPPTSGPKT